MSGAWTIRRTVAWMAGDFGRRGIPGARLDADLLVAHALGMDRVRLFLDLDRPLSLDELGVIRDLVARRRRREPVAYILGRREFYGRCFEVGPAVLIPRPDTETLVEAALAHLGEGDAGPVLDLCTGSGAVAHTLAAERPSIRVDATDVSEAALDVARRNAHRLDVGSRVALYHGDLFDALPRGRRYRLVVANPPYVAEGDLASLAADIVEHEPLVALRAGPDGRSVIDRISSEAHAWLEPGGHLLIEVGAGQAADVIASIRAHRVLIDSKSYRDLAGIERVVEAASPLS